MIKRSIFMKKVFTFILGAVILGSAAGCSLTNSSSTSNQTGTIAQESMNDVPTDQAGTLAHESINSSQADNSNANSGNAVKPGHYIQNEKFKFSFVKAKQYDEIAESEYYTNKPENGKKYLVLFFDVENVSSKNQFVNSFYFKAYEDDYSISESYIMGDIDGYSMFSGEIAPGKKTKGYLSYEVDPGWKSFEVKYQEFGDNGSLDFIVTPSELS